MRAQFKKPYKSAAKRRRSRKPSARGSLKPATARAVRAIAQRAVKKEMETKYVGEQIISNALVQAGASTPAGLGRLLARIPIGNDDSTRIGDRVEPISATSRFTVHFQNGVSNNFEDLQYHLLILAVKGAKTAAAVAGGTPAGQLLKNGVGGNTDPTLGAFTQTQFIEEVNHYPVNTDQYTVLKHFKHRFAKGSYDVTGAPGAAATSQIMNGNPCVTFTYKWKPPPLLYNSAADSLPTNHYPVFIHWVSVNDGGAYSGNLKYGLRTDVWYKDA